MLNVKYSFRIKNFKNVKFNFMKNCIAQLLYF